MRIAPLVAALLTLPAVALAQPRVHDPSPSTSQTADLNDGEILVRANVDGTVTTGHIMAVVEAPADEVWAIVSDFANQDRWVPDMYDATVVSASGGTEVVSAKTNLPWPLADREYTLNVTDAEQAVGGVDSYVSSWTYAGGNMNENRGYWLVQPWQGSESETLVVYEFEADTGIRAPDGIERNATRRMLPGILQGLRDRHDALY